MLYVLALLGCPTTDRPSTDLIGDADTDTDTDTDSDSERSDTGIAYLGWFGDFEVSREEGLQELRFGVGALGQQETVCWVFAEYESTGVGKSGCPDCTWSFTTKISDYGEEGDHCDDMFSTALWEPTYWNSTFRQLRGWAWSDVYLTDDSALYDVIFVHYESGGLSEWVPMFASGTSSPVIGESTSAEFHRLWGADYHDYYYR